MVLQKRTLHLKFSFCAYIFLCFTATLTVITTTEAATDESYVSYFCPNTSTFTPNGTYQTNLKQLLSRLSSNSTRKNGYYTTTVGVNSATVYGAFLCRGDLTANECQDCVSTAAKQVVGKCPVQKKSVIWFAECMVRYSDESFFRRTDDEVMLPLWNTASVSEQGRFMEVLSDTMNTVADEAAKGGEEKKFATEEANISSFQMLYTLAQCTPDLSELDCEKCLKEGVANLPSCCYGKQGGRVLFTTCNIRYELYPFYHRDRLMTPITQIAKGKTRISGTIIIAIVAPILLSLLLLFVAACWMRARRDKDSTMPEENVSAVQISSVEYLQFDIDTIITATNNFSDDNKLGEGGFGPVYRGKLFGGQYIAVKRLSRSSSQGTEEFKNEVVLVAKLQHRNLVRLLGFCLDGEEKMLIYEFVPNKSLDHFLFEREKQQQLNWSRRYNIINGIARGMLYLHEDSRLRIVHRDLKAANILLDEDLNPKISDFGMARIFGADQTQGSTNRVVGTLGYMSPEYAIYGRFSVKTDVYSFGILVLEIISGKKITSFHESGHAEDLLNYAWKKWRDGTPLELVDRTLGDSYSRVEVSRCIHIGLCCVQEDPAERPTMNTVILMLSSHSVTVEPPNRPAGYIHTRPQHSLPTIELDKSDKSTNPSLTASVDETSITQVYPR
ncbi:hypothetical protein VNO77_12411 [Canavalia gladiata]|uniref:Uncharacterized protein n=1 Tax=Canavalia gladiata TaxID=3824 RepID=A0AAN9QUE4_CANGL